MTENTTRKPLRCRSLALPVAVLLLVGVLPVLAAVPAALEARAAREPWETLVRTIGFRSASEDWLGQYAAIGDFNDPADSNWQLSDSLVTAREEVSALSTEFGLFAEEGRRFRLLGANGLWLRFTAPSGGRVARADAADWEAAWSFQVKRPRLGDMPAAVIGELRRNGMPPSLPVCVRVFRPSGAAAGWLQVGGSGAVTYGTEPCGSSTSALFLTDALPSRARVATVTAPPAGFEVDPISRTRFAPPDMSGPGGRLITDQAQLRNALVDIEAFLISNPKYGLWAFNEDLRGEFNDLLVSAAIEGLADSYVIPGDPPPEPVDMVGITVGAISGVAGLIPGWGSIASGVISTGYSIVTTGIAFFDDAERTGPRVMENSTNAVITTQSALKSEYGKLFDSAEDNINDLYDSIVLGCVLPPSPVVSCSDDRRIAAWIAAAGDIDLPTAAQATLLRRTILKGYEHDVYRSFIEARGALMETHQTSDACPTSEGVHFPATNAEFWYYFEDHAAADLVMTSDGLHQLSRNLVISTVWRPHAISCQCDCVCEQKPCTPWNCTKKYCDVSAFQTWGLGWLGDEAGASTPVHADMLWKLFGPYDTVNPSKGGLGLSYEEVSCAWVTHDPDGLGSHDPCEFAFHDLSTGHTANPGDVAGMPNTISLWVANWAEVQDGRPLLDPDVLSPFLPRLEYEPCAAELPRSAASGAAARVYFSNMTTARVEVYRVMPNGAETLAVDLPLQSPFPAVGQLDPDASLVPGAAVGDVYVARTGSTKECLGVFTVPELPAGAVVPYRVAEVHGSIGILPLWPWT